MGSETAKNIAIYGGAFDPFHNGHLAVIAAIVNTKNFDHVIVLPSGPRPDKQYAATVDDRLQMVRIAIQEAFGTYPIVSVDDAHAVGLIRYGAVDIFDHFRNVYPQHTVWLVIGDELLGDLPGWKDAARLRDVGRFLVVSRPGVPAANAPEGFHCEVLKDSAEAGVLASSSVLRRRLSMGASCRGLMPTSVIAYCEEKNLYGYPGSR